MTNSKGLFGVSLPQRLGTTEFVVLTAMLMASNALAIDIMLPAMAEIGASFDLENGNDRQLVIVSYLLGFGLSQLIYGPLTDRFGRRSVLFISLACYVVAGVACVFAPTFELLIAARVFHGASAGGSRVIAVSSARDLYSGREMAKVMSLVMMIFMVAPIAAPAIGQLLLLVTDWRGIFWALVIYGAFLLVWVLLRLPETLPEENKIPLKPKLIASNYWKVLRTRESFGYTVASGFLFSALMGYVASSEQLYHEVYHTGAMFPILFGGAALAMSVANMINARLVERLGMRRISHAGLIGFLVVTGIHTAFALAGPVPFWVFYTGIILAFFTIGFQGPNFNAIAMEPLKKQAGSGAAVMGFASSFVAASIGGLIARQFDGTLTPILIGHLIVGAASLAAIYVTEKGKLFQVVNDQEPT